jgi:hypothetical protein
MLRSSWDFMAAELPRGPRQRRPAVWPWLVMPLIVLVVFYALFRVHHRPGPQPAPPAAAGPSGTPQP